VTASEAEGVEVSPPRARSLGVRARLLLAFFGISAFAVLAAAAGIYAFGEVGGRLDMVETRVQPTLSSLELLRSAERIVAAAPALLATTDRQRRDEVKAELEAAVGRLNGALADLKRDRTELSPLLEIEPIASSLMANLAALEDLVARRLDASERVATLRRDVFQTNDEVQRLFAPWQMMIDGQIAARFEGAQAADADDAREVARELALLFRLQQATEGAERQVSAAIDILAEASTTDQARRLPVFAFQLGRALADLEATAAGLDPKLRPLFLDQAAKLREFAEGPDSIPDARKRELALVGEGHARLAENASLSGELTAAVDRLANTAAQDISDATRDALMVQRLSTRVLVGLVVLSLLTSVLIVWLYVSRNIVRRLTALSDGMLAIAGGRLHAPVAAEGADEIAAMGRAVEIFRKNTLERDELLAEKEQAADRLEKQVEQRTRDLARSVEELRALGEVSQAVSSTLDVETVLATIVTRAVDLSGSYSGIIYEFDESDQTFRAKATHRISEEHLEALRAAPVRMGEGAVGRAGVTRTIFDVADIEIQRHLVAPQVWAVLSREGLRSLLAIPLVREERVLGGLVILRRQPGAFSSEVIGTLQTFAAQSVMAIQNARLFREIEEKSQQLEVASKHKSQFLANMSHELRTPLNAILGYTELILDSIYGDVPDRMRSVLERVQSNGLHLLGLINDVLDLSKIEAGQLTLSIADYSLADVVQSVFSAVESLASEKRLIFKVELPANLPAGRGDERRIAQVLLNLTGNAIKFTDAGEVAIRASAANGSFKIAVCDTGPGIATADQHKIFEEFQQADSSSTRKKGGSGLGLSISKRIIEMHRGRIWVESDVGRGSTFIFTLPVNIEHQAGLR